MPRSESHAWWADVQDVRETIERRRDAERTRGAGRRRRTEASAPRWDDPAWADDLTSPRRRFARGDDPVAEAPALAAASVPDDAVALPLPAIGRRTVQITGRPAGAPELPRLVQIDRRRPARRPAERFHARPDRLAMWAVVLAFFLIFVAATSSSQAAVAAPGSAPALTASR